MILLSLLVDSIDAFTHILQGCIASTWQAYYTSSSEATLKDMGKIDQYQTPVNPTNMHCDCVHNSWYVLYIRGGSYQTNFLHSVIFLIFQQNCGYTRQLLNIMFIFDRYRCHYSWAADTPVKYECDSKNLTSTFARSEILLIEKLTNGAVIYTPNPRLVSAKTLHCWWTWVASVLC